MAAVALNQDSILTPADGQASDPRNGQAGRAGGRININPATIAGNRVFALQFNLQ